MAHLRRRHSQTQPIDVRDVFQELQLKAKRLNRQAWIQILFGSLVVIWLYRSGRSSSGQKKYTGGNEVAKGAVGSSVSVFPQLPELIDRDRLWPPDLDATISQCRWSAYNSELVLHSLLTSPTSPSFPRSLITSDPEEADLFFVPLFPSCYLFDCWVKANWTKTERCDVDESYIQPVMKFIQSEPYWKKNRGQDHLIVHPMDHGDGYYTTTSRAMMNSSTHLVVVGDKRPPPYSKHFRKFKDLVIPSSTHLLNSYYLNPMDYLDSQGHPLVTPRGLAHPKHPSPPATKSEIFEPTPPNPQSFISRLFTSKSLPFAPDTSRHSRPITAIFRGGVGTSKDGESYALSIRSLFYPSTSTNSLVPPFSSSIHPGFSSLRTYDILESSTNEKYALSLSKSKFGLAPPGYTLDTTRIFEYLAFGVIPVFIGTGPRAGQVMPFENDFDWQSFSIFIPREEAHLLPFILERFLKDGDRYERMRKKVWDVGRLLVLEEGKGNVWKWLIRDLCRLRRIGTGAGEEIANN